MVPRNTGKGSVKGPEKKSEQLRILEVLSALKN